MKTYSAKVGEVARGWYVVDATDKILGRMASRIAMILMGKHRPVYTPHVDTGEFVVVVNAEKVVLTGKKEDQKQYMSHSQYPGNEKIVLAKNLRARHPEKIVEHAVKGMIPHNRLGRQMITKLKVYKGPSHPHTAQKPEPLAV